MKHRVQGCPIDRTSRTTGPWASNHTRLCKKLPNEKRLPTAAENPCRLRPRCISLTSHERTDRNIGGPGALLGRHCKKLTDANATLD